jgi:hypothetical protein
MLKTQRLFPKISQQLRKELSSPHIKMKPTFITPQAQMAAIAKNF